MTQNKLPTERSFGLSVGAACALFAAIAWWREHDLAAQILGAVSVVLIPAGALVPSLLRIPNRIWWRLAQALGWLNSRILLSVFFFVVLTPAGLVMRLAGKNPLKPKSRESNWTASDSARRDAKHYEHLF